MLSWQYWMVMGKQTKVIRHSNRFWTNHCYLVRIHTMHVRLCFAILLVESWEKLSFLKRQPVKSCGWLHVWSLELNCHYKSKGQARLPAMLKQHEQSLWTLKIFASDSFWSIVTFVMHKPGPKNALECPGAEILKFMTLVSSTAPHWFGLWLPDIFMGFWWHLCGLFNHKKFICMAVHVQGTHGDLFLC